jgi:hypothetical protein
MGTRHMQCMFKVARIYWRGILVSGAVGACVLDGEKNQQYFLLLYLES